MKILRALQIAKREWGNIRVSLEKFGDIGEFDSNNYVNINPNLLSEGSLLVRNLIEMDNKLSTHWYFTQEAAYVFTTLASRAGERLGLTDKLAQTFGRGYSWVRTGWFDPRGIEEQYVIKQLFFMKIFFPLGGYFNWYFDSPEVKMKLRVVLDKYAGWQDNPRSYIEDVRRYRDQLEPLWRGLSSALNFPVSDRNERYQKSFY
jgi:hypothetical protein